MMIVVVVVVESDTKMIEHISSVASFLLWGGGARPPNVPTEEKNHVTYMRERGPQKYMYFQVSKYICIYIIQSMQWYMAL